MMLCVVLVTIITSMMYFDNVFWVYEWQECLLVVTSRTNNSLLTQNRKGKHLRQVRGAVPTPIQYNTQFQRLVIRSRVCRIERSPSRTRLCQRRGQDAPSRLCLESHRFARSRVQTASSIFTRAGIALFAELALGPGSWADGPRAVVVGVAQTSFSWISSITSSSTPCAMWASLSSVMNVSKFLFFKARVLTSSKVSALLRCGKTFLTTWKHKSISVVGFRASVSPQTSSHNNKPKKLRVNALKAVSAAGRNSCLLYSPSMNTSVMPGDAALPTSLST